MLDKKYYSSSILIDQFSFDELEKLGITAEYRDKNKYLLDIGLIGLKVTNAIKELFADINNKKVLLSNLQKEITDALLKRDNLLKEITNLTTWKQETSKMLDNINNNIISLKEQLSNKEKELKTFVSERLPNVEKKIYDECKIEVMKRINEHLPEVNNSLKPYIVSKVDEMLKEHNIKVGLFLNKIETTINNPLELINYTIKLVNDSDTNPQQLESARNKIKEVISNEYKEERNNALRCLDIYMDNPVELKNGIRPTAIEAKQSLRRLLWKIEGFEETQDNDKEGRNTPEKPISEVVDDTQNEESDMDIVNNGKDLDVLDDD